MRIWVTRTAPEADATAERLRAMGHAPLVAPVLKVVRSERVLDLGDAGAIAFTSRNGVQAFVQLSPERGLPAYAVGEATARAAREAGFQDVRSADGDVDDLAELIGSKPPAGPVIHAGPEEPAGDLAGALTRRGVKARLLSVYATVPADPLAALAALGAEPPELDAVLVHSPRAARQLAALPLLQRAASLIDAICISEAAAEPLRALNFRSVAVAPLPKEAALLNLVAG